MSTTHTASSVHTLEQTLFFVLLQLVVIILSARAMGELAKRVGQPRAVGEIVAGLVLGPSLFGHFLPGLSTYLFNSVPSTPISVISQVGLILLMFQIGIDFDFSHLTEAKNRKAVTLIAVACILFPFTLGLGVGKISAPFLAPNTPVLPYALFVATALAITAVPILGRIMMEYALTRTPIGTIAISAAAVNDVVGWLLLALISALTMNRFSSWAMVVQLGLLAGYVLFCFVLLRPAMRWIVSRFDLSGARIPGNLLGIVISAIFLSSLATFRIGIFAIFGGFMMGVLLHDNARFVELWKNTVGDFVIVFFLPVFFTYTGMRTDIGGLDSISLWGWCLFMLAAAVLGKLGGAYIGARAAGLDKYQASTIGILMNTRALMELIVLNIGFDLGFIPQNVFTMLVIMALITTVMAGIGLRSLLPQMGWSIPKYADA